MINNIGLEQYSQMDEAKMHQPSISNIDAILLQGKRKRKRGWNRERVVEEALKDSTIREDNSFELGFEFESSISIVEEKEEEEEMEDFWIFGSDIIDLYPLRKDSYREPVIQNENIKYSVENILDLRENAPYIAELCSWARTYTVASLQVPILIVEDVPMEGGQCSLWPGALFLCKYIENLVLSDNRGQSFLFDFLIENPNENCALIDKDLDVQIRNNHCKLAPAVLELGAGSGILSMVFSLLLSTRINGRGNSTRKLDNIISGKEQHDHYRQLFQNKGIDREDNDINQSNDNLHISPVVVTEQESSMPYLEANLRLNKGKVNCTSAPLCWGKEEDIQRIAKISPNKEGIYDIILGCEITYNKGLYSILKNTILALSKKGSVILLSHNHESTPHPKEQLASLIEMFQENNQFEIQILPNKLLQKTIPEDFFLASIVFIKLIRKF